MKKLLLLSLLYVMPAAADIFPPFVFPHGSTGSVQYREGGIFKGTSTFVYAESSSTLYVGTIAFAGGGILTSSNGINTSLIVVSTIIVSSGTITEFNSSTSTISHIILQCLEAFNPIESLASPSCLVITSTAAIADNALGGSIAFAKPGTPGARRYAIVQKQTSSDADHVGMEIWAHPSSTSGDPMVPVLEHDHLGQLFLMAAPNAVSIPVSVGSVTASGVYWKGTNTNNSAAAGFYGEYVSSTSVGVVAAPTTTEYGDLLSISLTAGDWDVTGVVDWTIAGSSWSGVISGISSTSGNSGSGLTAGDNRPRDTFLGSMFTPSEITHTVPAHRVSINSTTTYYLKYNATYISGTPAARGRISARRMR